MVKANTDFVQFLGTGAGDFFDRHAGDCQEGYCPRVGELAGRNIRQASSLFIAPNMLVDFFSDAQLRAFGIPGKSIRHLLITHAHQDHFQPLAICAFAASLPHPLRVYGSTTVINALDFATTYRWDSSVGSFGINQDNVNFETRTVSPGEAFFADEIKVTPVLANHMIDKKNLILQSQALNYVLERRGKTLFYGVDSSLVLPESFQFLSQFRFDIAVFDATFGHLEIDPFGSGHQNFAMLDKTVAQFRQAKMFKESAVIVADHLSQHHVEPYDEIVHELSQKGITLAYDGMTLEF